MKPSARTALTSAMLVAATLTGCGLSPESAPRPISAPRGPFQELTSPSPSAAATGSVSEKLYLVKDGKVVAVLRRVEATPTVDQLVADLLNGPTQPERDSGISSALLGSNLIARTAIVSGLASIELSTVSGDGAGRTDEVLAFAQIVLTLTERPEINGVVFLRDQKPVGVPRADGSLSQGPLTAADYASLLTKG